MRSRLLLVLIACACMFAGISKVDAQKLNSKTEQQIIALLQEKNSRTPAQVKLDSRLLQAMRESKGQKMAPGTELVPANVEADRSGNLEIDIRAFVDDHIIQKIENAGGKVIYAGFGYNSIRARVNFTMIETIAAFPEIQFIEPAEKAFTAGEGLIAKEMKASAPQFFTAGNNHHINKAIPTLQQKQALVQAKITQYVQQNKLASLFTGTNNSQGDRAHRSDDVRSTYGYEGQGIRIGVISDSYGASASGVANDIATGNLPGPGNPFGNTTPVTVLQDFAGSDEGRAMLHIVHDVAPRAQLFFATANIGGQAGFAANIISLRNTYNCDIIIDDIFYFAEAAFQDGTVAQAVNTVTQGGCLYFSSAGNAGSILRGTAGVYEGDFSDAGSPVFTFPGGAKAGTIHNFGSAFSPIDGDVLLVAASFYNLAWSDPAFASGNDYDLFLVSAAGAVKASSTTTQSGTQPAYEQVTATALVTGDKLIVFKTAAAAQRAFALNSNRGALTIFTNGQTHGHASAALAYAVAATPAFGPFGASLPGPFPNAFTTSNQVETFSSEGPRRIFYNPDGSPVTPDNLLFGTNGGTVRSKPDITAADGVITNLPSGGLNPFYGTSAAAPHAGAIAALLKCANPAITQAEMRTLLTSTALDIEGSGVDANSGAGIIQAFQAMQQLNPAGVANISLGTVTVNETAPAQNNNGFVDPGESASMVVQLKNLSFANATAVSATISTNTPGIVVTQNTASYGVIAPSGNFSNTVTPYTFNVPIGTACGSLINFYITVNFGVGGPSPQTFLYQFPVGNVPGANINSTLGTALLPVAGYTSSSGTINQRINRFAPAAVCGTQKALPGLFASVGTRPYHAYTFTNSNPSDQCVTVIFSAANGANMYAAAYNNNGFIPATPDVNYLADQGSSTTNQSFAFTAPFGQSFTIVVNEVNVGTATGSPYNLKVSLAICAPPGSLPLTWLDFTAQPKNKQVALEWKVANETSLSHYEVEYSADGRNFNKLFNVAASNAASLDKTYDQVHSFPVAGNNYYRIKQADLDGRSSYSPIRLVRMEEVNAVTINPNPANAMVSIQSATNMKTIRVYNATGQLVLIAHPGSNTHNLDVSKLPAGSYTVKVETKNTVITQKLIKN